MSDKSDKAFKAPCQKINDDIVANLVKKIDKKHITSTVFMFVDVAPFKSILAKVFPDNVLHQIIEKHGGKKNQKAITGSVLISMLTEIEKRINNSTNKSPKDNGKNLLKCVDRYIYPFHASIN